MTVLGSLETITIELTCEDVALPVYTLNPLEDDRWEIFLTDHPAASVFHSRGWLHALRLTYGFTPVVYTTSPPGFEIANGILLCHVRSWLTGRRLVSVPFADHCEPLVDLRHRSEILEALRGVPGADYVELRPRTSDWIEGSGFQRSASFHLHRLDLQPGIDDIRKKMHKSSIERKVRRAEREALGYEEGTSAEFVRTFYRLMLLTRQRHGVPPQPPQWFTNLVACLGDRVKIRLAWHRGRAIAGMLTIRYGATLVYKYGCSDADVHYLGAMPFLFWKAIEDAKSVGQRTLDLGRSDPDNIGLITFKDRLGAVSSIISYARWPPIAHRRASRGEMVPKRLLTRLPRLVLKAIGTVFYRHVD